MMNRETEERSAGGETERAESRGRAERWKVEGEGGLDLRDRNRKKSALLTFFQLSAFRLSDSVFHTCH